MDSSCDDIRDARIEEIERLIQVFKEKFKEGTSGADSFLTIGEIEQLWGELQDKTNNVYSDIVRELMSNVDESDLIRRKKENISGKE